MKTLFQIVRSNEKAHNRNAVSVLQLAYGKYVLECTRATKDLLISKINKFEDQVIEITATGASLEDADLQFTLRAVKAASTLAKDIVNGLAGAAENLWDTSMREHARQLVALTEAGDPLLSAAWEKATAEEREGVLKALGLEKEVA